MRQELGINLLVYKEKLDKGIMQSSLLREIKEQGISLAEVRREYILDEEELIAIRNEAENLQMDLCYSVPEKIVEDNMPNQQLEIYLKEAEKMNAKNVKFNIGTLYKATDSCGKCLAEILKKYYMTVTIENDQTEENGTLQCTKETLQIIEQLELPIGYTMDLGNWYWQKEDPTQAFDQLKEKISVFHLKNIDFKDDIPRTVMVEEGKIPWESMIRELNSDVKIFLEYPILAKNIAKQIEVVREIA